MFLEVIVLVILTQKVYMYVCLILDGFQHRAILLYSSLNLVPNIILPSCMRIGVKHQLAVATVDSDIVGVL